ncbi:MAG: hypothetical protein ACE15E_17750 [Acidobacteriota bacterium]
MKKHWLLLMITVGLVSGLLYAKDFWEKPYRQWSAKDCARMLSDSPWARSMTLATQTSDDKKGYREDRQGLGGAGRGSTPMGSEGVSPRDVTDRSRGYGMDTGSGVSGAKELYDQYVVRFFSAPMIRQAYVRALQIDTKYDSMSPEMKQAFDAKMERALNISFPDQIVVSLTFETNNRELAMEVNRQLNQVTKEQLKQKVYLITDRLGRIDLMDYAPPSPDGTGAKFIFPRNVQGGPVLTSEDKEVRFELFVPGTEMTSKKGEPHKVFVEWKVAKMRVGEQLFY